jgi:alpha/beta superfamily hydrolase
MNPKTQRLVWQGQSQSIEVAIDRPEAQPAVGVVVIAHPHPLFGGTMDNKVVQTIARAFLHLGFITVRSNFRGVGLTSGEHDHGKGETEDKLDVVRYALETLLPTTSQKRLALAGFSFGAFVSSLLAKRLSESNIAVEKLVLVGTACSRFEVADVPANTLVIHGETDDTVPLKSVFDWAKPQDLPVVVLPGVEHFFHGKLTQLKDLIVRMYPL